MAFNVEVCVPFPVLMVLTSHAQLGNTGDPTGSWLEELATPYFAFIDAGLQVQLASISGGSAPLDPASLEAPWISPAGARFIAEAASSLTTTRRVSECESDQYSAIFLVGGSGAVWDFPSDPALKRLIERMHTSGALICGICHGVVALAEATGPDGLHIVKGRRVTGISVQEEELAGLTEILPVLPEQRLKKAGSIYLAAAPFSPNVVAHGNLLTGQNPASAAPLAKAIVLEIARRTPAASAA